MALVKIIHAELGPSQVSEVEESSLYQWHQSGWRRLTDDDAAAQPEAPAPLAIAETAGIPATEEE